MDKAEIINAILEREGGYTNDPSDSGGETNHGITKQTARQCGYIGPMEHMPREVAFSIYATLYWDSVKADDLVRIDSKIAAEVVDTCVNMGPRRAAIFLQRGLNVLNNRGALYKDVSPDGKIGPATLEALEGYLENRDRSALLKAMNCLQGAFYIELCEKREKDEKFLYGWLKHRV